MTYKELVDSIKSTVDRHYILQDFGYGALTDIKTVDEGTRVNYPYAFLNPTQSTRTGQTVTYRFNLIVMDVAQEDPTNGFADYLAVQSNCQQYIDDILANLRFAKPYKDFDLTLNVNLTPFKERFQDTVAGMTATLEIELPLALNDCLTPIDAAYEELITRRLQSGQIEPLDFDGYPDGADNFWKFFEYSYTGQAPWIGPSAGRETVVGLGYNSIRPVVSGNYRLEFQLETKWNEPEDGSGRVKYGVEIYNPGTFARPGSFIDIPWVSAETLVPINITIDMYMEANDEYYFLVSQGYGQPEPTADVVGYELPGSKVIVSKQYES